MTGKEFIVGIDRLITALLVMMFVGLKLTGFIAWSWWTIFIPYYVVIFTAILTGWGKWMG